MPYNRRDFIRISSLLYSSAKLNLPGDLQEIQPVTGNRLVLLGTQGGPLIRSYKQTPAANLILFNGTAMIIDTGFGVTFKLLDAGVSLSTIKYIFITHHHSDHNLELGPLLYNAWIAGLKEPIHIYGPVGLKKLLSAWWEGNSFDIETRIADEGRNDIRELAIPVEYEGGPVINTGDIRVEALKNIHPPINASYSLKFRLGDKKLVFSGDTQYYPPLADFSSGADYLVHEVMNGPAVERMIRRRNINSSKLMSSILSHHTLAKDVGRIASAANVKTLVLNHFVPADDPELTAESWRSAVAVTFKGNIIVGKDLLSLPF